MKSYLNLVLIVFLFLTLLHTSAQQNPDSSFTYKINKTAYEQGEGPVIMIDEAHNNYHTKDVGFYALSKLLSEDGYKVIGLDTKITNSEILGTCEILIIANPLSALNIDNFGLPNYSAFTETEIETIVNWVSNGGSLFLIADHMPFAGGAYKLGKAFGFEFLNGFAYTREGRWPPSVFKRKDGTLSESPITNGTENFERIDSIATFTGSAFKAPKNAIPVLCFLKENYSLQPNEPWKFGDDTPSVKLDGYLQGAITNFGQGRVAVFGEAAMFSAQKSQDVKIGFNSEHAPQNVQFTLNLIHWLDRVKGF